MYTYVIYIYMYMYLCMHHPSRKKTQRVWILYPVLNWDVDQQGGTKQMEVEPFFPSNEHIADLLATKGFTARHQELHPIFQEKG